jgi:hypothetical protein
MNLHFPAIQHHRGARAGDEKKKRRQRRAVNPTKHLLMAQKEGEHRKKAPPLRLVIYCWREWRGGETRIKSPGSSSQSKQFSFPYKSIFPSTAAEEEGQRMANGDEVSNVLACYGHEI